jgi:hypothetical protein
MRARSIAASLFLGLLLCVVAVTGCRALEPGTSLADQVVRELAPKPGELMYSEGADEPSRVQDRLANLDIMRDPRFAYTATEPEVDDHDRSPFILEGPGGLPNEELEGAFPVCERPQGPRSDGPETCAGTPVSYDVVASLHQLLRRRGTSRPRGAACPMTARSA